MFIEIYITAYKMEQEESAYKKVLQDIGKDDDEESVILKAAIRSDLVAFFHENTNDTTIIKLKNENEPFIALIPYENFCQLIMESEFIISDEGDGTRTDLPS